VYPPGEYPTPLPCFPFPVAPPAHQPGDSPTFQVCINVDWLPYIAGALKQLLLESTWVTMSSSDLLNVQGQVFDLIAMFGKVREGCGIIVPDILCLSGTFADLSYGYSDFGGGVCTSTYVPGTGWESCYDAAGTQEFLALQRDFDGPTIVRSYKYSSHWSGPPTIVTGFVKFWLAGVNVHTDNFTVPLATSLDMTGTPAVTADRVELEFTYVSAGGPHIIADDFEICYRGTFPLSVGAWTESIDFTAIDGGFAGYTGGGTIPTWSPGVGWISTDETCYIHFQALHPTQVTYVEFDVMVSAVHKAYQGGYASCGTASFRDNSLAESPGGTIRVAGPVTIGTTDFFNVQFNVSASPLGHVTVVAMRATGIGVNPFH
jgi:hypothetical protein